MILANLPNDLESEILARVPAKSLQELKTTCKRWYTLFKDSKFVEKNKKLSSEAARETFLLSNHEVYSIAGDLHSSGDVAQPLEFTGKLSKDLDLYTISHCDGLMLCQAKNNSSVVVWNPCTGETKMIKPRTRYQIRDRFALGYDDSRRGYKILRFGYYQNEEKVWFVECEMYDLSSGSWSVVDSFILDYRMYCSGVSLRGDTYFVAGDKDSSFFLMKFDFTAERFVRLPLPFQSFDPEDTAVLSVVRDEKLSVCHQDNHTWSHVMRIWVSSKVDEEGGKELSWRKDFVLTVDFDKFQLRCVVNVASFLLDEEKKVAVCCDVCDEDMKGEAKNRIYIVGEDMYKQVYDDDIVNASLLNCPLVLTYVPSLVHIH
ncbi:putative F-box/kelch-repeat protein At3g17540 isoform X1 [Brassica rapa]|uniref:F-box domain-containing protein n=1 Tax=Brassica campestris TaxID=3711 RepID=M4EQ68_BRACM|nr:putative F-box/kelch-repeat protein At3g17540 isoform X1 [Brassica rapa]XP_033132406.1 putative F-box/kelch-repeat protein At3g17540 isoform X1 [Brassica rapa]XP_033132407.1 putative F-box/kelch-repeat protein At3g17540 isoform X1 [Brassica rapa]XP_033132408.1 putative F-box/kelch-repeat protein At3g17540 isoform X1 [Brassica rapa]